MLEFDDIQHILLTRAPALSGRYEFLSFRSPVDGRAWLAAISDKVPSAKVMRGSVEKDKRWITVAFTFNGLRALGVNDATLATFPQEFREDRGTGFDVCASYRSYGTRGGDQGRDFRGVHGRLSGASPRI